jgi:hypothetical protein
MRGVIGEWTSKCVYDKASAMDQVKTLVSSNSLKSTYRQWENNCKKRVKRSEFQTFEDSNKPSSSVCIFSYSV